MLTFSSFRLLANCRLAVKHLTSILLVIFLCCCLCTIVCIGASGSPLLLSIVLLITSLYQVFYVVSVVKCYVGLSCTEFNIAEVELT